MIFDKKGPIADAIGPFFSFESKLMGMMNIEVIRNLYREDHIVWRYPCKKGRCMLVRYE